MLVRSEERSQVFTRMSRAWTSAVGRRLLWMYPNPNLLTPPPPAKCKIAFLFGLLNALDLIQCFFEFSCVL